MNDIEFNEKYKDYLEEGYYGLSFDVPSVTEYLDKVFGGLILIKGFKYKQIKMKFNSCRFYTNLHELLPEIGSNIGYDIEKNINQFVFIDDEINKRVNKN